MSAEPGSSNSSPPNIAEDFVVVDPQHAATPIKFSPTMFEELGQKFDSFKGHVLVSSFAFDTDWPTWEVHPAGDEIVVLLTGAAVFVLETDQGESTVELTEPGEYVIVPKGTWHTARVSKPTRALFITPGEGTENRDAVPG